MRHTGTKTAAGRRRPPSREAPPDRGGGDDDGTLHELAPGKVTQVRRLQHRGGPVPLLLLDNLGQEHSELPEASCDAPREVRLVGELNRARAAVHVDVCRLGLEPIKQPPAEEAPRDTRQESTRLPPGLCLEGPARQGGGGPPDRGLKDDGCGVVAGPLHLR